MIIIIIIIIIIYIALFSYSFITPYNDQVNVLGRIYGEGAGGGAPPPPPDDLRFSNTIGILQEKKTMWFIGVEVEKETSAPPPKKFWIRP